MFNIATSCEGFATKGGVFCRIAGLDVRRSSGIGTFIASIASFPSAATST